MAFDACAMSEAATDAVETATEDLEAWYGANERKIQRGLA